MFPIERLRELEAEGVIGRLAENHYGFGLMGSANYHCGFSSRERSSCCGSRAVDLPYRWRRETYPPIDDWKTPSQAVLSALSSNAS